MRADVPRVNFQTEKEIEMKSCVGVLVNNASIEDETERVETHQIVMRGIDELSTVYTAGLFI